MMTITKYTADIDDDGSASVGTNGSLDWATREGVYGSTISSRVIAVLQTQASVLTSATQANQAASVKSDVLELSGSARYTLSRRHLLHGRLLGVPVATAGTVVGDDGRVLADDAMVAHLHDQVAIDVLPGGAAVRRKLGTSGEIRRRPVARVEVDIGVVHDPELLMRVGVVGGREANSDTAGVQLSVAIL
eukprot:scpid54086/ scgid26601/ 